MAQGAHHVALVAQCSSRLFVVRQAQCDKHAQDATGNRPSAQKVRYMSG